MSQISSQARVLREKRRAIPFQFRVAECHDCHIITETVKVKCFKYDRTLCRDCFAQHDICCTGCGKFIAKCCFDITETFDESIFCDDCLMRIDHEFRQTKK